MKPTLQTRTGLLVCVTALHVGALGWLLSGMTDKPVAPPTPLPMVVAEMLPAPQPRIVEQPRPQAQPEPKPQPKPQPRPAAKPQPQPKPVPKTTDSEKALTAPKPAERPRAQAPTSAPEPATPAPPAPLAPPSPPAPAAPPSPPRFNAAYLNNPPPAYPPLMRRAGEEGRVVLRVLVTPEGMPGEVRVLTPSSSSLFDEAALAAVRKWRFVPARQGDTAVAGWVNVPIEFKLSN